MGGPVDETTSPALIASDIVGQTTRIGLEKLD